MNKDAYFFSHDSNSKDDPKCVLLIEQLGLEGYGIFWILVETLRDQPNYKYPLSLLPAIARRYNTSAQKVESVVKSYNLFKCTDDEFFFSSSLINRMETWEASRLKKSIAGKKGNQIRWDNYREIAEQSQCDNNAIAEQSQSIAMKLKETKLKETKINEELLPKEIENNKYDDIAEIRKLYLGTKDKANADKKLPSILKKYSKEEIIRGIGRYNKYVKEERKTFSALKFKIESTYWNGGYETYLDKNFIEEVKTTEHKPLTMKIVNL